MLRRIVYITIITTLFLTVVESATVEEILITNPETEQKMEVANNNYLQNPQNILMDMESVLSEFPNNARAHQIRGKVYYRSIGDIDKSVSELITVQNLLNQIPNNGDSLPADLKRIYSIVLGEINLILPEIEYNFADLRMKIRGLKISRLCRIENANIVFQYDRSVYESASAEQKLRLVFLEDKLKNATFQFSEWDTLNQEMYFAIKYFPIVITNVSQPYAITINNEFRYHFDLLGPDEPPIEIDWSDRYRLVNSLPDMTVELTHLKSLGLVPKYPPGAIVTRPYFSLEESGDLVNSYVPVIENENVDINILDGYPGQKAEKVLFKLGKIVSGSIIIIVFYLIR